MRPGRTIELVEATLRHTGRDAIVLRAWLLVPGDTRREAVSDLATMPPPDAMAPVDLTTVWHGGFIASLEARRIQARPGRAQAWVRTPVALLDGEPVSDLARAVGVLDIANGVTVPVSPQDIAFPNIDLAAHFLRIRAATGSASTRPCRSARAASASPRASSTTSTARSASSRRA